MSAVVDVIGWGAVTPVGLDARQSCAAVRAKISGVRELQTAPPDFDAVYGATVPVRSTLNSDRQHWLVSMACRAIVEATEKVAPAPGDTALLLILPLTPVISPAQSISSGKAMIAAIEQRLGCLFAPASAAFDEGHAAPVLAMQAARRLLAEGAASYCLIAGVDSLLNDVDICRLQQWNRLYVPGNPQGVIPGEGAAALLVSLHGQGRWPALAHLIGAGIAREADTVLGTRTSVGNGLLAALRNAVADCGLPESGIEARASDSNGERYRALESLLASARFYRTRREKAPLLLPAMSVADMGGAAGPFLVIAAATAMAKGYLPAASTMCEMSSEGGLRGALLIARPKQFAPPPESSIVAGPGAAIFERKGTAVSVIPEIIRQHAEESSFLWVLRDSATRRHDFTLDALRDLELRIDAHLDGLMVAGEAGWEVCRSELKWKEGGEFFAAAAVAFAGRESSRLSLLLDLLAQAPDGWEGLSGALEWLPLQVALPWIENFCARDEVPHQLIGIAAAAGHRHNLESVLESALAGTDAALRARALKAAGELGRSDLLAAVAAHLGDEDSSCRYWAAWSYLLLARNPAPALAALTAITESDSSLAGPAAEMAVRRMEHSSARAWSEQLLGSDLTVRAAVRAMGALGDPDSVPLLIGLLNEPPVARLAAGALVLITGCDPEQFKQEDQRGADEGAADKGGEADAGDDLPRLDAGVVARWWNQRKGAFEGGRRYLCGERLSDSHLLHVLRYGSQPQRYSAAVELAMINPGQPLFNVCAPAARQKTLLGLG